MTTHTEYKDLKKAMENRLESILESLEAEKRFREDLRTRELSKPRKNPLKRFAA